ncbi:YopX family protein [Bacillus atrophaeus]|uniref:YopX family protein n=1 Tax=Bacillus atrophaeus TaxID=1452 RepID=UPI002E1C0A1F|nr:YopX family protein [Bacillus atrophaeus]
MNTAYRVWDGERMYYWEDLGLSLVITGGGWSLYRHTNLSLHPIRLADSTQKNAALMWGTGLKDKTGKLIFQRDITMNHRSYTNELLQVVWQEGASEYSADGVYWTKEIPGFRFKRIKRGMTTVFVSNIDLEVVGDVYQNPELLEAAE